MFGGMKHVLRLFAVVFVKKAPSCFCLGVGWGKLGKPLTGFSCKKTKFLVEHFWFHHNPY